MKSDCDMSRIHQANLMILREIDRICRKYSIKYILDAGTLIGTAHHRGFIPWDNDADVAFARNQCDAFMKVVKRELPQGLELVEPDSFQNRKGFYNFTARIIYKNSRHHKDSPQTRFYEGKLNHLWVDLFIIDRLSADRIGASITKLLRVAVYGMAIGHRYELGFKKYSLTNKIFVGILAGADQCVPMKAIFPMQKVLALKNRRSKGGLHYYNNYQPDFLYVTVDQDWCDNVEDAPFEGTQLMILKGWYEVLTLLYEDYVQLPPEEQRVSARSSMEVEVFDQSESGNCSGSE